MRRPPEDLDRDIFAQSRAQPEAASAVGLDDANAHRTRQGRRGMVHCGVTRFVLEELDAVVGAANLRICAAMHGETREAFRKFRSAPSALCSVAGADAKPRDGVRRRPGTGS